MVPLKGNLKTVLADKLEPQQLKQIYKTYDIVGDVAIVRVPEPHKHLSKLIAEAIMDTHREVKSVWRQVSSVSGVHRLRGLEFLLGEKTTETRYKEHGCVYKTDLRKAYFSPRLSYERLRIAKLVQRGEVVLNMFAGVGCYSISIAKHSQPLKVYSVDVNSSAVKYLRENIRLNRVADVVVPIQGDAKRVTEQQLQNVADRVLLPLPERAYEYLDYAMLALKPAGGCIHFYGFEYANNKENAVKKAETKVSEKLRRLCRAFQVEFGRIVRPIGPRWYQVVLDIHVKT
ncbi:MAG TPA: class I SAM-dependent methyltransferase family protein [Candidatus Bathyarchaeota archaeon]|nr:class I SAM-dependent methyltransferase family protein [Candidatus Bathyarchaeota archaeon]